LHLNLRFLFCSSHLLTPPFPSFSTRRSSDLESLARADAVQAREQASHPGQVIGRFEFRRAPAAARIQRVAKARMREQAASADHQDRKSTRLNSSHVKISYAVFCLKKKKNAES